MPEARIVMFTLYADMIGKHMAKISGIDLIVSKAEGSSGLLKALDPYLTADFPSVH
jgi:hypothetical protein